MSVNIYNAETRELEPVAGGLTQEQKDRILFYNPNDDYIYINGKRWKCANLQWDGIIYDNGVKSKYISNFQGVSLPTGNASGSCSDTGTSFRFITTSVAPQNVYTDTNGTSVFGLSDYIDGEVLSGFKSLKLSVSSSYDVADNYYRYLKTASISVALFDVVTGQVVSTSTTIDEQTLTSYGGSGNNFATVLSGVKKSAEILFSDINESHKYDIRLTLNARAQCLNNDHFQIGTRVTTDVLKIWLEN